MKQKVSLVLSGGGARGMAHIGVIEELTKRGYEIHSVVGTSMGALVGGVYALGKMEEFKHWLLTLDRYKVFSLVDFTLSRQGLIKGERILNKMRNLIPDMPIEHLPIFYAAVAVDILHGEEVVFTQGSIYEAIRASIAIPTVFTPQKIQGRLLVDGGVLNNIPISYARRIPEDLLVAVNVNANVPLNPPMLSEVETKAETLAQPSKQTEFYQQIKKYISSKNVESLGYFDMINQTVTLMINQMSEMSLKHYSPDLLINVSRQSCGTFDFYKAEELMGVGRLAAQSALTSFE
ncbi:MAG: patatin-like phospholipase family protein [Cyclobacteriaceae bacterium]